ncbi:hypothetical protein [Deinococcus sp.]|uniref:hypothetical protein n=1 Tax=Deinococcus sp. TaxID=47478 RepID=UPI003B5C8F8A
MNNLNLTALLPLAAFASLAAASLASAAPSPAVSSPVPTITDGDGHPVNQNMLYTESRWERVLLPHEALSKLGSLRAVKLTTANLPSNVIVSLGAINTPRNTVGLWVRRSSRAQAVHQKGRFTLTNPATKASYTFEAMVVGAGR